MNINKGDYPALLNIISAAADRTFTEPQIISLIKTMECLGWAASYRITIMASKAGNMPRNVYGFLLTLLEEEIERLKQISLQKESWAAPADCASEKEFQLTMKCISTICKFRNATDILKSFSEYMNTACNKDNLLDALTKAYKFYQDEWNKLNVGNSNPDEINGGI